MQKFISLLGIFGLVLLLAACGSTSHIYIVRHGEKVSPSGDVALSGAGLERAEALKDSLKDKKIAQVYSTNYKRTQQTAAPTAMQFGKDITTYNNGDSLLQALVKQPKGNVLITGHSNTVPQMIRAVGLTLSFEGNIPDNQYDNLFIITVKKGKQPTLQAMKYGLRSE